MENEKIKNLIEKLNYYTKKYDEGKPEITDQEWDNMYFELQKLENYYHIYYEDSPTQKVNYQIVNKLNKVEHNHLMLSLDKTKEVQDVVNFIGSKDYIVMEKMDGLTCSLRYTNGKLVSAETRGNGLIGEDILHNALQVKNIPNKISYKEELIVDGEIICTYKDFEPFEVEYKNPRNFASGSIRLLNSKESSMRRLSFIAWDVIKGFDNEKLLSAKLNLLNQLGFTTVDFCNNSLRDIQTDINLMKYFAQQKYYPIDGCVIKFNDIEYGKSLGETDHHFKNAIAYKFYDEEYETSLLDIEYTMGRTGKLTPVAILEPIDIDGTEVSRANLHNLSILKETLHGNGWQGQKVKVAKMNMIIPQIVAAEEDNENTKKYIDYPHSCPICGDLTEIIQENDSEVLYCGNPHCEGKLINKIEHFFSKKGLDAKGLSKATIEKLIDWGWVNSVSDMFILSDHYKEWTQKNGFGEKSVSNIIRSITESCNNNLESAISAAGIPLIGRTVAKQIAGIFDTYGDFKEAILGDFDFSSLDGFGYEMNKSLKTFNYDELDYIVENFLTINNKKEEKKEQKLEGLTFCVTGKIKQWKNRDELSTFIAKLGGRVVGSVSANMDYLINNDIESTSAKNKKAKDLGKKIIDEQTFIEMFDLEKFF